MNKLDEARKKITAIDAQIASLFEQRMRECAQIASYKKDNGLSISDPAREAELIKHNVSLVEDDTLREYYALFQENMMSLSKKYQSRLLDGMTVAYCGVPGAFASIAAGRLFPGARLISFSDFESAYKACESGECDSVVLPFENSYAGEVAAVTDLMFSGSLYINQELELEAVQNLIAPRGANLSTIKEVVSHPQALCQCAEYIRQHGFKSHEYHNTASAAKMVSERGDLSLAAIASEECAELYGLEVVERRINSSGTNTTRFAAFSRILNARQIKGRSDSHFILMFTVNNEAGSLAKTLNIIGAHGYNMCCLRSRPNRQLLWNYYFFVELEGNIYNEDGREMLQELGSLCDSLKLVGSF